MGGGAVSLTLTERLAENTLLPFLVWNGRRPAGHTRANSSWLVGRLRVRVVAPPHQQCRSPVVRLGGPPVLVYPGSRQHQGGLRDGPCWMPACWLALGALQPCIAC